MILLDGTRYDIFRKFPNFQEACKKGTLFLNTISYAPYTSSSLYAIFTGMYGSQNGVNNYHGSMNYKKDECKMIAEYLKDRNYFTIGDAIRELVVPDYGFIKLNVQTKNPNFTQEHKELLIECKVAKENNKNFFLFLHNSHIHNSLVKDVGKKIDDFNVDYFKNKEKNASRYDSYLKEVDNYFGYIMQQIKNMSLDEDSLIIILSDHGASTGEKVGEKMYGSFCYDYTIHTYSIFINPELFPKKEIDALIRTIDITPTIMDILNIKETAKIKMQGKSLIPIIKGVEKGERIAFSETGGLGGPTPSPKTPNVKSVRTKDFKLIINTTTGKKEFYNLKEDPEEKNNLSGKGLKQEEVLWEELKKFI